MAIRDEQKGEIWNQTLTHGDKWPRKCFRVLGKAADGTTTPQTGFTVKEEIYSSVADTVPVKTLVGGDGFLIEDELVTYDTTVDLPKGVYFSDVQITLSNGDNYTQYTKRYTVTRDFTN